MWLLVDNSGCAVNVYITTVPCIFARYEEWSHLEHFVCDPVSVITSKYPHDMCFYVGMNNSGVNAKRCHCQKKVLTKGTENVTSYPHGSNIIKTPSLAWLMRKKSCIVVCSMV